MNGQREARGATWLAFRTLLAAFGTAVGMAIYYPRRGFKRYALLCGPIIGVGSAALTSWWLTGRANVHRFEVVFAALLGAAPGVLLYVFLTRRKWNKLHAPRDIWLEEPKENEATESTEDTERQDL